MRKNTPQDVWKFIDVRGADECWPWTGSFDRTGYGRFGIGRKYFAAHRVAFYLAIGGIELSAPKDRSTKTLVLHKCDNRSCCNTGHLFLGNQQDNMRDMVAKGRMRDVSGENNPRAKLSIEKAKEIRWIFSKGIAIREIAKVYDVSWSSIDKVISGERYS